MVLIKLLNLPDIDVRKNEVGSSPDGSGETKQTEY